VYGAKPFCRRLAVRVKDTPSFSSCEEIRNAKYTTLRKFCKEFGGKRLKSPTLEEIRQEAYSVHRALNPCNECSSDLNPISRKLIYLG
jgi:hypothetical protein